MNYIWEFEFYTSEEGNIICEPMDGLGEGTFGSDLDDAFESAIDWFMDVVDEYLISGTSFPKPSFNHEPTHGGKMVVVAVGRELSDIPAMIAADAARYLGVSTARVSQLIKAGLLDSWKDGSKRMVSKDSIEARKQDVCRPGRPRLNIPETDNALPALKEAAKVSYWENYDEVVCGTTPVQQLQA